MTTREILKRNLKFFRKQANLTQEELAEKINCSPKYISSIESKNSFPSAETIDSIATALNIRPAQLFDETSCASNLVNVAVDDFIEKLTEKICGKIKADIKNDIKTEICEVLSER